MLNLHGCQMYNVRSVAVKGLDVFMEYVCEENIILMYDSHVLMYVCVNFCLLDHEMIGCIFITIIMLFSGPHFHHNKI